MLVLVVISLAMSVWLAWYSKHTTSWIVGNEFKTRKDERDLFRLLLSMELARKHYFILDKPEYREQFQQNRDKIR